MKKISILIPVYNVEKYLHRCLDSICSQLNEECELVIINDGSKDCSGVICNEYQNKYPNLIRVFHQENRGTGVTRNSLLNNAQGEYVWFVDSDDFITENILNTILDKLDGKIEILSMCFKRFGNNKYGQVENKPSKENLISGTDYLTSEKVDGFLWNKIYKLCFLKDNHICFNEKLNSQEDWLFNIQAFVLCKKMLLTSIYSYNYFQDNQNSILHLNTPASNKRDIENTLLAEKELLELINLQRDKKVKKSLLEILYLNIAGFFYSLYTNNISSEEIKRILSIEKERGLYPVPFISNKRANIFLIGANIKPLFIFLCWIHNKINKK